MEQVRMAITKEEFETIEAALHYVSRKYPSDGSPNFKEDCEKLLSRLELPDAEYPKKLLEEALEIMDVGSNPPLGNIGFINWMNSKAEWVRKAKAYVAPTGGIEG